MESWRVWGDALVLFLENKAISHETASIDQKQHKSTNLAALPPAPPNRW